MKVKFWGARGSVPISRADSRFYGGNTTSVEVVTSSGCRVIIDAGTGIRDLGNSLLAKLPVKLHLLFTHYHWDHILGFPFFVPGFIPGNELTIYGQKKGDKDVRAILTELMSPPNFPVPLSIMGAKIQFVDLQDSGTLQIADDLTVRYGPLFHPNGVVGFRFESENKVFTFLTDIEHESEDEVSKSPLELSLDADIVAYDCQYTPEQYPGRKNWGHSTWESGLQLVKKARAKSLYMIHHDPAHNDQQVDAMLAAARAQAHAMGIRVEAVYEGMEFTVGQVSASDTDSSR